MAPLNRDPPCVHIAHEAAKKAQRLTVFGTRITSLCLEKEDEDGNLHIALSNKNYLFVCKGCRFVRRQREQKAESRRKPTDAPVKKSKGCVNVRREDLISVAKCLERFDDNEKTPLPTVKKVRFSDENDILYYNRSGKEETDVFYSLSSD